MKDTLIKAHLMETEKLLTETGSSSKEIFKTM